MSNKIYFLMEIAGLVLLGYFAFSDMVFFEKFLGLLFSLFLVGYPISMGEDKKEEEMYQKGAKESVGRSMNKSQLINYYLFPDKSFKVLDVSGRFIRVELTRLDNPNTTDEYSVKFDKQELERIKSGFWYKFSHNSEFIQGSKI